ncbi:MAG: DEAD/DEAH box helicase [Acidimicrobiia bacterium]
MSTFRDLGVPTRLVEILNQRGITAPFPIQEATIPDLMAGRDTLGRAPTGSGKTLAFGLPLVAKVGKATSRRPRALVLAPARELAEQISRELTPFAKASQRWVTAVYGGVGYESQRAALKRGADVLVATPGRLADLISEGAVSLADVDLVVVDEADRMADMGFLPQVRLLLDMTNPVRQTAFFSATLDQEVASLTQRYQTDPVTHHVGGDDNHLEAAHYFWQVDATNRIGVTADIISSSTPTLVFTRTRHGADKVARLLEREGIKAAAIHGGRSQSQRTRALEAFGKKKVDALIATDVAARGIHVDGVSSVVHFDLAADHKDYLHRSGRTARAGAAGVVVSLVMAEQLGDLRKLQRQAGFHNALHDPDNGWLSVEGGSRIGERPVSPASPVRAANGQSRQSRGGRRNRRRR